MIIRGCKHSRNEVVGMAVQSPVGSNELESLEKRNIAKVDRR